MKRSRASFLLFFLLSLSAIGVQAQKQPAYRNFFDDTPYVSLKQAADFLKGHLSWRAASEQVELRLRGHSFRFFYHSPLVLVDGRRHMLERETIKNAEGLWVPAQFFMEDSFFDLTHARLPLPPPGKETATVKSAQTVQTTTNVSTVAVVQAAPTTVLPAKTTAIPSKAIHRIVIDPGHGGKDPGAIGPHGTAEKTVALGLSQEVADLLREKGDYEVLMTRMDDTFIPLSERANVANKHEADLFISIHCNASTSSKLRGFEVYFLSEKATDPQADAAARFENDSLALEGKSAPTPNPLQKVLRSLVKTANINESSELGALVHQKLSRQLPSPALGVKQASFYVLRGAEMPSILVEVGFLSNSSEEKMLRKSAYRRKIAQGILEAVEAYDVRKQKARGQ